MRMTGMAWMPRCFGGAVLSLATLAGCANQQESNVQTLRGGFDALNARQYDAALGAADKVLAASPNKTLPAEAHYLRGRVFEERGMATPSATAADLQRARTEYIAALDAEHAPDLEGRARAGVANVAFHQDDNATALAQWQQAYPKLDKPEDKLLTLYQIGRAAQRLGKWDEADGYFSSVESSAPGTDLAKKARAHRGARAFVVQLATFADAKQADAVVASLAKQGVAAQHLVEPGNPGLHLVRLAPVGSWQAAVGEKQRFSGAYPNAIILP